MVPKKEDTVEILEAVDDILLKVLAVLPSLGISIWLTENYHTQVGTPLEGEAEGEIVVAPPAVRAVAARLGGVHKKNPEDDSDASEIVSYVVATGEVINVLDTRSESRFTFADEDIRTVMAVPVWVSTQQQGKVAAGAVCMSNKTYGKFTDEDADLLKGFAATISKLMFPHAILRPVNAIMDYRAAWDFLAVLGGTDEPNSKARRRSSHKVTTADEDDEESESALRHQHPIAKELGR